MGLFGLISSTARIENVGILNVNIEGVRYVGALVGENKGHIINSHADKGEVKGIGIPSSESDFDARVNDGIGGLAGSNDGGSIMHSYANVDVKIISTADNQAAAGALAGSNLNGATIRSSYASGNTSNNEGSVKTECFVGGLVGYHSSAASTSTISNSYARGTVNASACENPYLGHLIGFNNGSIVEFSYTTRDTLVGSTSSTVTNTDSYTDRPELKSITDGTDIFANWSLAAWDFGTTQTYPLLRYVRGDNADDSACDLELNSEKPLCGNLLPAQHDEGLAGVFVLFDNKVLNNETILGQLFSLGTYHYDLQLGTSVTEVQMNPYAAKPSSATVISIRKYNDETEYFSDKVSGSVSSIIPINEKSTTLTIAIRNLDSTTSTYIFSIEKNLAVEVAIEVPDGVFFEGDEITLTADARNGSGDYRYSWQQGILEIDSEFNSDASLTVLFPDNLVEDSDATSRELTFTVRVEDTTFSNSASTETTITIQKKDNGNPDLILSVDGSQIRVATISDPDSYPDSDSDDGIMSYQWQKRVLDSEIWMDTTTTDAYTISADDNGGTRYRVEISYQDPQRNPTMTLLSEPFRADLDDDNNGLIDVYYLEDFNALRYQLDGSGYSISSEAAKTTRGCRMMEGTETEDCRGYELRRNLDFKTSENYLDANANQNDWTVDDFSMSADTGWDPIGGETEPFDTLLDGNNYVISNVQINRDTADDGHIGLFGVLSRDARIENMGLLDVDIQGRGDVGSLVAENKGTIINSYAEGGVVLGTQHRLGGLVAINDDGDDTITIGGVIVNSYANVETTSTDVLAAGGLVGSNRGTIRNSYASGAATGPCDVGGLIGENLSSESTSSQIINSYAAGGVRKQGNCTHTARARSAGGLVAYNEGLIRNSYVRGLITSDDGSMGSLVGTASLAKNAEVESSYWDSTVNNHITDDGLGKASDELMMPIAAGTTPTEIYYGWSTDDWDFGTTQTYPVLRHDEQACNPPTLQGPIASDPATGYPLCGSLLLGQRNGLSHLFVVADNKALANDEVFEEQIFSSARVAYDLRIPYATQELHLRPYTIYPRGATISIKIAGDETDYFDGNSGELSEAILPGAPLLVEIEYPELPTVLYTLNIKSFPLNILKENIRLIAPAGNPQTLNEGQQGVTLEVVEIDGGFGTDYRYQWTTTPTTLRLSSALDSNSITFDIPNGFVEDPSATTRSIVLEVMVNDGFSPAFTQRRELIVKQIDQGVPDLKVITAPAPLRPDLFAELRVVAGTDPDGIGTFEYQWQERNVGESQWRDVGFNLPYYVGSNSVNSGIRYRVRVSQTDGRGNKVITLLGPFRINVDDDRDGLIDIYYLEDLNAIRHSLQGRSYKENADSASLTFGCPADGCQGYELRRDLDFNEDASYSSISNKALWTSGSGWQPIGNINSIFEGNDYAIYNLFINNSTELEVGLFSSASNSVFRRIGLIDIDITVVSFISMKRIGGLIGTASNTAVENSYVTGTIRIDNTAPSSFSQNHVGGLIGEMKNDDSGINASISNSFTNITIDKTDNDRILSIGGLVAINGQVDDSNRITQKGANISNSYAVIHRTLRIPSNQGAGGLVGINNADIRNSYAYAIDEDGVLNPKSTFVGNNAGTINNSYIVADTGSFARTSDPNTIGNSYWNGDTSSGPGNGQGGTTKTTVELQAPTTAAGIYSEWDENNWDFGTSSQYPAVRYTTATDVLSRPACSDDGNNASNLPPCGAALPNQHPDLRRLLLSTGSFLRPQAFQYAITDYE